MGGWSKGLSFLLAVGQRLPSFLAGHWPELALSSLPHGLPHKDCLLLQSQQGRRSSSKMGITILQSCNHGNDLSHVCIVYWLEASHESCPHSRGGDCTGMNIRRRASWGHLSTCPPQMPFSQSPYPLYGPELKEDFMKASFHPNQNSLSFLSSLVALLKLFFGISFIHSDV